MNFTIKFDKILKKLNDQIIVIQQNGDIVM